MGITEKPMDRMRMFEWLRRRGPGLIIDLAVNVVAPVLLYDALSDPLGEVRALLASSAPPLLWGIGSFVRSRRVDALSVLAMIGIALSLLAFVGGGSAQMLQMREKMVTLLIGSAFLISAAIGKPLIYPLARATVARESAQALADFEAKRDDRLLRHTVMVMTLAWGVGLLVDVAVSVTLIYSITVEEYLIVGPIIGYGTIGSLTLWTMLYRRHRARFAAHARAAQKQD